MNKNSTELVFILDCSGSMAGMEGDVIGSFNTLIQKYRNLSFPTQVTLILAGTTPVWLYEKIPIEQIAPLTGQDYLPAGFSALLDTVGTAIHTFRKTYAEKEAASAPKQVLFVIITDGFDNASIHFSLPDVLELIAEQKKQHWEFLFPGADLSAIQSSSFPETFWQRMKRPPQAAEDPQRDYDILDEALLAYRARSAAAAAEWDGLEAPQKTEPEDD